jgi:hypothetical protein
MKRFLFGSVVTLVFALFVYAVFAAPSDVGVVLMHGKWGSPQSMSSLARELESKGYLVSNTERMIRAFDFSFAIGADHHQPRRFAPACQE